MLYSIKQQNENRVWLSVMTLGEYLCFVLLRFTKESHGLSDEAFLLYSLLHCCLLVSIYKDEAFHGEVMLVVAPLFMD